MTDALRQDSPLPLTVLAAPVPQRRNRAYLAAIAGFAIFGTALLPFADLALPAVPEFNIFYITGVIFGDVSTALLLFAQFRASGRASLLVLGMAYLFTAAIAVPHLLYFSEFAPRVGWLAGAPQTAAWLWHAWHLAFPAVALGFVAVERWAPDLVLGRRSRALRWAVTGVLCASVGLTILFTAFESQLPLLHDGRSWRPITFQLGWTMALLTLAAFVGVLALPSRYRVMHLWLSVALVAFFFDIALNMLALERFALGWYAGRMSGLLAASFLFVMLLRETARLYVSLGEALQRSSTLNAELERRVAERTAELRALAESLKGAVDERDVLLSEVYHRVNNNLQTISGLLLMERRQLPDAEAGSALERMARRARAMGLVHQQIMTSGNLHQVDLQRLLADLAANLRESLAFDAQGIGLEVAAEPVAVDIDKAMPLGLLVNELVTNAAQHAFPGRDGGRVRIALTREGDMLCLVVADDGVGLSEVPKGFGSRVVQGLVRQLDGRQDVEGEGGVLRRVVFPLKEAE